MAIIIEIQSASTTDPWMLAATIGLVATSFAQAVAAAYQARAARRQAEAADRQVIAADRQSEVAAKTAARAIIADVMLADDAAMPMMQIEYVGEAARGYIMLNMDNIGTGMAFNFALGHDGHELFVKDAELSKLYLPARVLNPKERLTFQIEKRALLSEGGVVLRYESEQHSQIYERLTITETNTLSVERLRLYRPYADIDGGGRHG
jgi:hypothetical protein